MYKLLIADDDEIICRGLATCIDWKEHGVEVIGTVCDGEMALEKVEECHPHIVLADINMPFMDGMEFSYQVRQKYPDIKIILITAYREFEYAKRAVELQVFDFVTKPFRNEEILGAVEKALDRIHQEETIQTEVNRNMDLIREKYLLEAAMFGRVEEGKESMCGFQSKDSEFTAAILSLSFLLGEGGTADRIVDEETALEIAAGIIRQTAKEMEGVHVFRQNHQMAVIFEHPTGSVEIRARLKRLMDSVAREDRFFLACGVGDGCQGMEQLPVSMSQARSALEYQYYFGHCSVIFQREIAESTSPEGSQPLLSLAMQTASASVQDRDVPALKAAVRRFFDMARKNPTMAGAALAFVSMELLVTCYREAGNSLLYEDFLRRSAVLYPRLLRSGNGIQLQREVEVCFGELYNYLEDQNASPLEKIVINAAHYMEEHFADPDLALNEVADHVHISASYLCALFKQYKQTSYVNYLNQIRMEYAKTILKDRGRKTYEAAFLSGFNSSQYFSSTFKKYTGMTPGEYRGRYIKG